MAEKSKAKKRAVQSEKRRQRNASLRSMYRTHIRKVLENVATGVHEKASKAYKEAVPIIDKMVTKGILHKNKAARYKSRLSENVKKLLKKD